VSRVVSFLYEKVATVVEHVLRPLRTGDGPNQFRLSAMETATTTHDGDTGWLHRPPAVVECPRCESEILQHQARDRIDCPRCVADLSPEAFPDLELRHMICPACRSRMQHGQRHPNRFTIPEWATCTACRYHWEFKHFYQ
jgi:hypothetical protein